MKRIIIEVDDLTEQEAKDLEYLLSDALSEFRMTRANVDGYMHKRYPATTSCDCHDGRFGPAWPKCPECRGSGIRRVYSEKFLADKRANVERRVALANKLLAAQVRCPKVEDVDAPTGS